MKHQALFSSKDKGKKISVVCCKFLFGALRVKRTLGSFFFTVITPNTGTLRPATVVVLNIKQFNFTLK